jgi:antitoxin MazE
VNGVIEIRPFKRQARDGWADDSKRIVEHEDDNLVWPEFIKNADSVLEW